MTDGGHYFNNHDITKRCTAHGTQYHVTAAYAPWINELMEGTNSKLLGRFHRAYAPELREEESSAGATLDEIPASWPDYFKAAIQHLNECIIPAFQYLPKELLLGLVINTPITPSQITTSAPSQSDVKVDSAYVAQQRLDSQFHTTIHAIKRSYYLEQVKLCLPLDN
jgi:hypothetical protein